jgi:hypothetical protein
MNKKVKRFSTHLFRTYEPIEPLDRSRGSMGSIGSECQNPPIVNPLTHHEAGKRAVTRPRPYPKTMLLPSFRGSFSTNKAPFDFHFFKTICSTLFQGMYYKIVYLKEMAFLKICHAGKPSISGPFGGKT